MPSLNLRLLCLLLTFCTALSLPAMELWKPPAKKLIEFGWDAPTPQFLHEHIATMEKNSPYDGVGIALKQQVMVNGKPFSANQYTITKGIPWHYQWFAQDIHALRQTAFNQFRHNFLQSCFHGAIDWFDDQAWETTAANFAILARISRETGCRGIMIDTEHYSKERQFSYEGKEGHSFGATARKARQRGRKLMKAIAKEQPDATLFFFFLFSYNFPAAESVNPSMALHGAEHGLLVPFTNGLYDELLPDMTVVDGCETMGYHASAPADYYPIYFKTKRLAECLIAPENLSKLRTQTQLAVSTFLDAYFLHEPGSNWAIKTQATDKLKLLEQNLTMAMAISDEYSWTWSEGAKWWPIPYESWQQTTSKGNGDWNRAVPGINQAMRRAKNPAADIEAKIAAGTARNLIRNGSFSQTRKPKQQLAAPLDARHSPIPYWNMWMAETNPQGTFAPEGAGFGDTTAVKAVNLTGNGCLMQGIPVKPGQKYLVRAVMRNTGNATGYVLVYWRKADLNWNFSAGIHTLAPQPIAGEKVWSRCQQVLNVPDGDISQLVVLLSAGRQHRPLDQVYFDAVEVYRLDP